MDFFEFASEYDEAATPAPRPAPPARTTSGSAAVRTPATTRPPSQAQTAQRPSPSGKKKKSSGFDFAGLARNLQQGWDFVRTGVKVAQQFKRPPASPMPPSAASPAPFGAPAAGGPTAAPGEYPGGPGPAVPPAPGDTGSPLDQFAAVLQSLRQQQPSPAPAPAGVVSPVMPAQAAPPRADGLALLRLILGNPQFQQVLQSAAAVGAAAAPRTVELPVPVPTAPQRTELVAMPLGAVLNAVEVLAGESMSELNETTREDEPEVPEYLVDEQGEFVVDPAIPEARAARVVDIFLRSAEAQGYGPMESTRRFNEADDELSESDAWARDAGFGM